MHRPPRRAQVGTRHGHRRADRRRQHLRRDSPRGRGVARGEVRAEGQHQREGAVLRGQGAALRPARLRGVRHLISAASRFWFSKYL